MALVVGMGSLWDVVPGFIRKPADAVLDVVSSAWHLIPGSRWTEKQLSDFARTSVGKTVLYALHGAATGAATALGGPMLGMASVLVSSEVIGELRGKPFAAQWAEMFAWQVQQVAKLFVGEAADAALAKAADTLGPHVERAAEELGRRIPPEARDWPLERLKELPEVAHLTPRELAAAVGVREDAAALALDRILGAGTAFVQGLFDPATGKDLRPEAPARKLGRIRTPAEMAAARAKTARPAVLTAEFVRAARARAADAERMGLASSAALRAAADAYSREFFAAKAAERAKAAAPAAVEVVRASGASTPAATKASKSTRGQDVALAVVVAAAVGALVWWHRGERAK